MKRALYKITTSKSTQYANNFQDCIRIGTSLFMKERETPIIYKWNGQEYKQERGKDES